MEKRVPNGSIIIDKFDVKKENTSTPDKIEEVAVVLANDTNFTDQLTNILTDKTISFTKETAKNCSHYRDSSYYGCIFSPTCEQFTKESKAGIWCARCFNPNMKIEVSNAEVATISNDTAAKYSIGTTDTLTTSKRVNISTVVTECNSTMGVCRHNKDGKCRLPSITLECGECASCEEV